MQSHAMPEITMQFSVDLVYKQFIRSVELYSYPVETFISNMLLVPIHISSQFISTHTPAVRNTHIRTHELCHNKPHSAVENLRAPTKTFQSCASFSNVRTCFQWCSRAGHRIRNGCLASRVHARVNCTTDRPHRQRVCADRKWVFPVFSITQRHPATGDAGGADDNVVMVSSSSS